MPAGALYGVNRRRCVPEYSVRSRQRRGVPAKSGDSPGLAACVKHFVGYGAPVGGRDYNTVELSHQSLFDDYFPPFQAAIEAGCEMVMTSFNTVDGIPVTANHGY